MGDPAGMNEEELLRSVATMSSGNPARLDAQLRLQMLAGKRQSETADKLVTVTADLVKATRRMMYATWALVILTALTAAISIFWRGGR